MKLLGIDYGTKRIGIALSDEEGLVAFPHAIIENSGDIAETMYKICKKEGVAKIIIGESHTFQGKENPIMPAVRALKETLEKETGLPVHFEPETLTTQEARRPPHKQGKTRKPPKNTPADAKAAALILQKYIDRTQHLHK